MLPKILLASCILWVCSSCMFLAKKIYRIHNPRIESTQSIEHYATKYGIQSPFYVYRDSATAMNDLMQAGIPEAYFFTQQGYFIPYKKEGETCNAGVEAFISNITNHLYTIDSTRTLQQTLINFVHYKSHAPLRFEDLPKADYYIIANWAVWLGKVNHIQDWQKAIEQARAKGVSITLISVCADFQEFWGMQPIKEKFF